MKKRFDPRLVGVLMVFIFILPLGAGEEVIESSWAVRPLVIDASGEEWSDVALFSKESPAVDVGIRNDAGNLYLLFVIRDNAFLSTLEATGLTIFLDPRGKKKKDYGLRFFRRQVGPDEFIQVLESRGQALSEEQKEEIRLGPSYILYDCEVIEKKKSLPIANLLAQGVEMPAFRYVKQAERTVFELRIPLGWGSGPGQIEVTASPTVQLGFEWGGLTKAMQAARLAREVTASEKGVERETASESHARGGRSGDFPSGGASSGLSRGQPKKYAFWLNVKLASPPERQPSS